MPDEDRRLKFQEWVTALAVKESPVWIGLHPKVEQMVKAREAERVTGA